MLRGYRHLPLFVATRALVPGLRECIAPQSGMETTNDDHNELVVALSRRRHPTCLIAVKRMTYTEVFGNTVLGVAAIVIYLNWHFHDDIPFAYLCQCTAEPRNTQQRQSMDQSFEGLAIESRKTYQTIARSALTPEWLIQDYRERHRWKVSATH